MGRHKPTPKKKQENKARSTHKAVKKTVAKPTKDKARKAVVAKKPSKSPDAKSKKPAKPAPEVKAKAPAKVAAPAKTKGKPAQAEGSTPAIRLAPDELRKQLMAKARTRTKSARATAFTLDDVRGEIAKSSATRGEGARSAKSEPAATKAAAAAPKKIVEAKVEHRHFGAASLADILGFNPTKEERPQDDESTIDPKYLKFYKLLAQLRDHVKSGLDMHTEETLKRSSREDTGDLSGYGQHMADAGTDAFDRDFALSMVSTEQEALFEIEEAIKRIKKGTYGICERTGKPIARDRLAAVPFARFSVESQAEYEKTRRRRSSVGGLFGDAAGEEGAKITEEDSE